MVAQELSWKSKITGTQSSACFRETRMHLYLPLYLSGKMTSGEGGWDIGSEGTQEISHVTHSLPPTATTKKCFGFFSMVFSIVLGSGFITRQAIIHQGVSCLPEGRTEYM